jgi:hypothetical protein
VTRHYLPTSDAAAYRELVLASRRRTALVLGVVVGLGAFGAQPAGATPVVSLVQVSSDPFSNPVFEHRTEVEPAIAVHGRTVVSAFQVGRGQEGGAVDIGVAVSTNAGATWSETMLSGVTTPTGGSYGRASDPSVAYDGRTDAWLVASLGISLTGRFDEPTRSGLIVTRSLDGGASFGSPVAIARAPHAMVYDKPWVVCDQHRASPFFGRCYALWDGLGLRSGPSVLASTSRDGGVHWDRPVRTADRSPGFGMVPVVRPDGSVEVVYLGTEHPFRPRIASFGSTDGGASWGSSVTIALQRRVAREFDIVRDPGLPAVAIDQRGTTWVAWSDCRFELRCAVDDIVLARSADGTTWSGPQPAARGAPATTTSLVTPALAADLHGNETRLALVYYMVSGARCGDSYRPMCAIKVGYTSSNDGAGAWDAPTAIGWPMRLGWFPPTREGYMWGDYVSDAITDTGKVVAVLPLATRPTTRFDVGMYAPVRGLPT